MNIWSPQLHATSYRIIELKPRAAVLLWLKKREHRLRDTPKATEQDRFNGIFHVNSSESTDKEKIHTHEFEDNDQEDNSHKTKNPLTFSSRLSIQAPYERADDRVSIDSVGVNILFAHCTGNSVVVKAKIRRPRSGPSRPRSRPGPFKAKAMQGRGLDLRDHDQAQNSWVQSLFQGQICITI